MEHLSLLFLCLEFRVWGVHLLLRRSRWETQGIASLLLPLLEIYWVIYGYRSAVSFLVSQLLQVLLPGVDTGIKRVIVSRPNHDHILHIPLWVISNRQHAILPLIPVISSILSWSSWRTQKRMLLHMMVFLLLLVLLLRRLVDEGGLFFLVLYFGRQGLVWLWATFQHRGMRVIAHLVNVWELRQRSQALAIRFLLS